MATPETLVQQAQALLDNLWLLIRRMDPDETDLEPYNDYYRERVEDLIGMAQDRIERRERLVKEGTH